MQKQLQFIRTQVEPLIDQHERVIILGDLFDIRYSVNTQVGCEVKNVIRELLKKHKNVDFSL